MTDENAHLSMRRKERLRWIYSAAITLLIFVIVGAHVHSRPHKSQAPTDISSQSRTPG